MLYGVKYCLTTFIMLYNRNYATYVAYVGVFPIEKVMTWELVWYICRGNEVDVMKAALKVLNVKIPSYPLRIFLQILLLNLILHLVHNLLLHYG